MRVFRQPALLASLLFLPSLGCGAWTPYTAEETVEETFAVMGSRPKVVVETFNGAIEIVADGGPELKIKVVKRGTGATQDAAIGDLENIDVSMKEQVGDVFHIVARRTDGRSANGSGASAVLHVPESSNIELKTSNGKLTVTGAVGPVKAHSSNGAIQVKGAAGPVSADTSNGPITVADTGGMIALKTSNGAITISGITDGLVTANTSNGSINFKGSLGEGEHVLTTSNGPVSVTLPGSSRFRIDAQTSNGRVSTGFSLSEKEKSSKGRLIGTIGGSPSAILKIRTSNGAVEIKKKDG